MVKKNQIIILIILVCVALFGYFFFQKRENRIMAPDCIFCKIITRQIPSNFVAENNDVVVIKDINPKAPTHLLIIPKKHIQDIQSFTAADMPLGQSMIAMAQELSKTNGNQHFRLVVNSGKDAGQKVFHVHMHYLAGETHHTDI